MSKKILAIALFAVMVLSLVPFASAAANDYVGTAVLNQNGTPAASTGDVWQTSINSGVVNVVIDSKYSALNKVSQDWYTDNAIKYDIYLFLDGKLTITSPKVNGSNISTISDIATVNSGVSTGASPVVKAEKDRMDGITSMTGRSVVPKIASPGLTAGDSSDNTRIKVGTFTAKKGGHSDQYVLEYYISDQYHKVIVNVTFKDGDGSAKPEKPLFVKLENAGDSGLYNVYTIGGTIYIDYANDINYSAPLPIIPVKFSFYEDSAGTVKLPPSGTRAKVVASGTSHADRTATSDRKFFTSAVNKNMAAHTTLDSIMGSKSFNTTSPSSRYELDGLVIEGATTMYVNVPSAADGFVEQTFKLQLEGADYTYATGDVRVVWRPVPRNQISNVIISQRNITVKVGETVKLDIIPSMQTTYSTLKLQDSAAVPFVDVSGMNVTGKRVGSTTLNVMFGNTSIDGVYVTVVAADATTPTETANQWRVIARTLNVRAGAGTSFQKVRTVSMNTIVTGEDTGTGWIKLTNGTYVSKTYVVPVTTGTATGNYITTASSLNVRSGPGTSYGRVSSYSKGTTVAVTNIQNGWAQTANGWVSTLYLQAI